MLVGKLGDRLGNPVVGMFGSPVGDMFGSPVGDMFGDTLGAKLGGVDIGALLGRKVAVAL